MIDEFGPPVFSYARRQQALDYESVANTALADAVRNLPSFRGTDRRAFRSYVYRIVKRRIADEYRKQASQPDVVAGYGDDMLGDLADAETSSFDEKLVETDATKQLLAHLTEDQREVVEMRVLTGLSIRETAAHTGRSVTAVKAMQRRALVSLRAIVTAAAILLIGFVGFRLLNGLDDDPVVVVNDPAGQQEREGDTNGDEQGGQNDDEESQSLIVESSESQDGLPDAADDAVTTGPGTANGSLPLGTGSTLIGAPLSGQLAFPGASGWAAETTTGGRGGRVVIVNSLENTVDPDDDLVTFREAMTQIDEPRIIVFSVAGTIDYRNGTSVPGTQMVLNGSDDDVTVACQSAPEPGITFVGEGIRFSSQVSNVIMRHCRFRNSAPVSVGSAENNSCLRVAGTQPGEAPNRYIFDHTSCMWATNTSIAFFFPGLADSKGDPIRDVSISNTIVAQGAPYPADVVGAGESGLKSNGPTCTSGVVARSVERCSLVGNFIAHVDRSSARLWGVGGAELINNIIYNFSSTGIQAKARPTLQNDLDGSIVGNLVKSGPDSKASTEELFRPIDLSGNTPGNAAVAVSGNYVAEVGSQPAKVETPLFDTNGSPSLPPVSAVNDILSMAKAGSDHLRCVGASRPHRDSHDQRVIDEFLAGTGTRAVGADQKRDFSEYPTTAVRQRWTDTDRDGMPDDWERKLNIEDPAANDLSSTYTNVEVFLNGQAQCPTVAIGLRQGVAFSAGETVSIPFKTNWQIWDDGQALEICIDDRCDNYLDPDGDQSFEVSGLTDGDHTATFTLRSPTGVAVAAAEPLSFTIR